MEILNMDIDKIIPYENNPRRNDGAVDAVAKSIETFGFKVPVIIDKNNVIVTGHTRYKAAMQLGLKEVPCLIADDLTEEQINVFRLADNKVGELATWDFEKLAEELEIVSMDMSEFGFEDQEDIDLDSFFEDKEEDTQEKEKKTVICPHCGQPIDG